MEIPWTDPLFMEKTERALLIISYVISAHFSTLQFLLLNSHLIYRIIVPWLNLNTRLTGDETHTPNSSNRLSKLPRQFCWEVDSHLKFKNALRTEPIQILIRQYGEKHRSCEYLLRKRYETSN